MSILVSLKTVGLNITASVKDSALPELITIIQANRDDTAVASPVTPPVAAVPAEPNGAVGGGEESVRNALKERGAGELLNQLGWDSYTEKILLLAAWHEARGDNAAWKSSDIEEVFSRHAKEKPPGNLARDLAKCIKFGWIHAVSSRTYLVTRTGWNKVGEAMNPSTA